MEASESRFQRMISEDRSSRDVNNWRGKFMAPNEIADLAVQLGDNFEVSTELTIELENFTESEQQASNLPSSKILPIPGK